MNKMLPGRSISEESIDMVDFQDIKGKLIAQK